MRTSPRKEPCKNQPGLSVPIYKLGVTQPALPRLPEPREDEMSKWAGKSSGSMERGDAEWLAPGPVSPVLVSCFQEKQFRKIVFPSCGGWRWHKWNISSKRRGGPRAAGAKSSEAPGRRRLAQERHHLQDAELGNCWEKTWGWWIP